MESLLKAQSGVSEELLQNIAKIKRDEGRPITRGFYDTIKKNIETLYRKYCDNDKQIVESEKLSNTHPYLGERQEIKRVYQKALEDIHKLEKDIKKLETEDHGTPLPVIIVGAQTSTSASEETLMQAKVKALKDTTTEPLEQPTYESLREYKVTGELPTLIQKLFRQQDIAMRLLYRKIDAIKTKLTSQEVSSEYLKLKIQQLHSDMKEIDQVHKSILMEVDEEDQHKYFTNDYHGTLTYETESLLIKMQELTKGGTNSSTASVELPKVVIPTFHGEYENWYAFNDIFTRLIHQNSQLTNTVKLNYLKSHLQHGAAQLIAHLPTIGDNYEAAWEIVQTRYNNKRLLASSYFNAITALPNIQHPSAASIRNLHDTIIEMLHNINNLQLENPFEAIVAHLIMKKLDFDTLERFENSLTRPREVPQLKYCLEFLLRRFQSMEASGMNKPSIARTTKPEYKVQRRVLIGTENGHQRSITPTASITCSYCQDHGHLITRCHHFRNISTKRRIDFINRAGICTNCLLHSARSVCDEKPSCITCNNRHHQLLHEPDQRVEKRVSVGTLKGIQTTLLATAIVTIDSICGVPTNVRTLIDPGSQVSLITEAMVQRLGLPLENTTVKISGIGANNTSTANSIVAICLKPRFSSTYKLKVNAYVLPKITMDVPEQRIACTRDNRWRNLILADPEYHLPAPVDLLLGADVYSDFIGTQIIKGKPSAIKTSLGWLISGPTQGYGEPQTAVVHMGKKSEEDMVRFWELEEVPSVSNRPQIDHQCELIFSQTTRRDKDGRYIVQLPLKDDKKDLLGHSRQRALQRFLQLEKKLERDPNLRERYVNFMATYIKLQHMKPVSPNKGNYYLPHHAVLNDTDNTKIRVVFDASMQTSTGVSLNDVMHIGPPLQNNLWSILLRWRKYRIVFTGDIEKMYRQIGMQREYQRYQTIIWRENKHQPLQEYQLTTVTYGTSAAPYLAIRTLHQLANDETAQHPKASHILKRDFYVDDVLTGADTIEEAQQLQSQLVKLLHKGKMELGKWSSNHPDLLKGLPKEKILSGNLTIADEQAIKTLGIGYNPSTDCFVFQVRLPSNGKAITKRRFLSEMSKIFDPLGWLAPLIIGCKIMYQGLWSLHLDWDDELPADTAKRWERLKLELNAAQQIEIPRYINYSAGNGTFELHGFCDASEHAYAAVLYSKITINGQSTIRLLTAKTRVAPVKVKLTIPRLELCGAVLLSRLVQQVKKSLELDISATILWSDSMVTIAWIQKPPSSWKSFVAHRVAEIQQNTDIKSWRYIRSEENPADCASRGVTSRQLAALQSWWNGPTCLQHTHTKDEEEKFETFEEKKNTATTHLQVVSIESPIHALVDKYSSLRSLIRITTHMLRWRTKRRGPIDQQEWDLALSRLGGAVQQVEFGEEYSQLRQGKPINKRSRIISLHPFLDKENVIRVGGRLENSSLPYEEKHPIILPYTGSFTNLVLDWGHKETFHGGNALTLAFIRKRFWIIRGVQAVKQHVHRCIRCFRFKIKASEQLMGNLPAPRVTVARPFTHTGVDYAGPFNIRMSKGRGNKSYKGYICIFICLTVKAIHIEVASDLTTQGFVSAFRRFTARRGNVADIYSDNGTNFVGASKLLQPINWHFIPPSAPHFGGLWEAGVKSIKTHLKKCIGDTMLTFEELTTLLSQIEACLNSRPLCPLTEDPESLEVLTPGHFLIGNALTAPPDKEQLHCSKNFSARWMIVQNIQSQFWKKWVTDYLQRLQQRPKWQKETKSLQTGDIVLLRDELLPPTRWKLGRILELHPGKDGLNRVVTIKTSDNPNIKRPITKVSPLPIQQLVGETDSGKIQERTGQPTSRQQPSRHTKQSCGTTKHISRLLLMTCAVLCVIGSVHNHPLGPKLNFTQPNSFATIKEWNNSGMYFDNIAKVELVATKWTLLIRYNLSNYWQEIRNMEKGLALLETACKNVITIKCDLILQQLQWQFNNIKQDNEFLTPDVLKNRRRKRGVGDTIGKIAGDMFGILSQREAEQYEEQFERIQRNEDYTLQLLRKQTSIIDNTVKLFKHSSDITAQQLKQLEEAYQQLDSELAMLNEYRTYQDKALATILLSLQLGLAMKHVEDTQRGLLQVLTGAKNHIIHPSLLPPVQLEREIAIILKNVPKSTILPGHGLLELHHLYQLMTVRTRITESNAIIAIELPLVQAWNYHLYQVIPVPVIINNTQLRISSSTKYLLVDQYRERFAPISSEGKTKCHDIIPGLLLCDIPTIYTRQSDHTQCEISMFLNTPVQHESCVLELTPPQTFFIKLHATNQWIFGTEKQLRIEVICGLSTSQMSLKHYGIIEVQPGCTLRGNNLHLYAASNRISEKDNAFIPSFNISTFVTSSSISRHSLHLNITTPNTRQLEKEISELQRDESEGLDSHHIHHYVVSHLILWTLIALGILAAIQFIRAKRRHRPIPPLE